MATKEVDRRQLQGTVTDAALGLLENLWTTVGDRNSAESEDRDKRPVERKGNRMYKVPTEVTETLPVLPTLRESNSIKAPTWNEVF